MSEPEFAWLIERDIHSHLNYWCGRHGNSWSDNHLDALRFSRRADAELMLTYHCEGIGRVVEHGWSDGRELRAEPPTPTPTGTELALEEAKVLLKHLAATVRHEIRCGKSFLRSTTATLDAAEAFIAGVPEQEGVVERPPSAESASTPPIRSAEEHQ